MHSLGNEEWRRNKTSLWWELTYGFKGWWLCNVTPCSFSSILGPRPHALPLSLLCDNPSVLGGLLSGSSVPVVLKCFYLWGQLKGVLVHMHVWSCVHACVVMCAWMDVEDDVTVECNSSIVLYLRFGTHVAELGVQLFSSTGCLRILPVSIFSGLGW